MPLKSKLKQVAYKLKRKALDDFFFTSESVAPGHPDKICDQISDAILDKYLSFDPKARVAIETFVAPNHVIVGGEVASNHKLSVMDTEEIIRNIIKDIGYNKDPFHWENIQVMNLIHKQSPEISMGVLGNENKLEGAGDQGIMFGYACNETPELMPAAIHYAHKILREIFDAIKSGKLKGLGPDAKSQVTLEYGKNRLPYRAVSIVVSIQHLPKLSQEEVKAMITPYVEKALPRGWMCRNEHFYVNPTGKFTIGGPESDTGLTGRKIIVDTYGGAAPHGGGAFSGKDPSKVDRSAAYAARYLAKNIVSAGLANSCLIQLSYAIGIAQPLSLYINTNGTAKVPESNIIKAIYKCMDLTPRGIRSHLMLDNPIYLPTATFGHFGRENNGKFFTWEKTDLREQLIQLSKK
jgi:S-adenosylmethionine synthetase